MFSDHVAHGLPLTQESFEDPPLEMGIIPFWFWNGDLDRDEMEWQLREYHDRGIRSLFIHGRMGLRVGYLSDAWFDRVRFCVEKAKEIGIDAWVYDEMDWPSGTAGKQVIESDPKLGQRYLELVPLRLEGPIFTFLEAHDERYVATGDANPIAAYGVRGEQYDTVIEETVDLSKHLAWEKTIAWEAPAGDWVLLYFLEKEAPFYIDTLNPASTEKFIELTHEKYRRAVGHEFGRTVPGFFTDEPAMYYYRVGMLNYVVPWSSHMFKIFRERRGYGLKPYLPALFADIGEKTASVRYDFWRTLTEQYAESYYKRIRDWCDEHGVLFTGHLLFEEHLRLAARCEGNFFKYFRHLHLIGVDHLYPKVGSREEPAQHVALKLGSSAAHHFGSTRLLCESMGGTYWNCTLERMKWMNNWEYVLGVNLFNNHGYHYTIEGERKRDWPPSQFYHHTWWKYYDRFTAFNARLSHILSGGSHVARVLLLYPINSIWTNYVPQERTRVGEVIEKDFQYLTDALLRLHYDFDYVDEDVLAEARIDGDGIGIADETFDILILPPVTHIKASTYEQIRRFLQRGGSVIADALVPIGLLEDDTETSVTRLDAFLGIDGHEVLRRFEAHEERPFCVRELETEGRCFYLEGEGLYSRRIEAEKLAHGNGESSRLQEFLVRETGIGSGVMLDEYVRTERALDERREQALREVLGLCADPDVTISTEDVFYLHRRKDGHDIYFLVNTRQQDAGRVQLSFQQVGRPELWDPNTGAITPIYLYGIEAGRLCMELDFPASESRIVVMRPSGGEPHVSAATIDVTEIRDGSVAGYARGFVDEARATLVTGGGTRELTAPGRPPLAPLDLPQEYAFSVEGDNVLAIGRYRMNPYVDDDAFAGADVDDAGWLEVEPGAWEMQLPQERDEEAFPVPVWYRASFDIDVVPADARMIIDGFAGLEHRLFVNGLKITDAGERSRLDAEMREIRVADQLRTGRNVVAIRLVVGRKSDGLLDLLKIVGAFALTEELAIAPAPERMPTGDWTRGGYPYFSGTGVYRGAFDVPADYAQGGRLWLEADCGEDVLEVSVNGSEALVAPWHPYRLDVTEQIRPGSNDIEIKVTNTLINILEGVRQPSGLFDPPRLVHERYYELTEGNDR
jgi:hypothetical protein